MIVQWSCREVFVARPGQRESSRLTLDVCLPDVVHMVQPRRITARGDIGNGEEKGLAYAASAHKLAFLARD